MGLDKDVMAAAIKNAILTLPIGNGDQTIGEALLTGLDITIENNWKVICDAIIEHIKNNAEIIVTMATHTHSGVTTGAGVSGPPVTDTESGVVV